MPGYTVHKPPDEPIILLLILPDWQTRTDILKAEVDVRAILDAATRPLYWVMDGTATFKIDFEDLIWVCNYVTRIGFDGNFQPLLQHPRLKLFIMVSPSLVLRKTTESLSHPVFGRARVKAFATLEEAFDFIGEHEMETLITRAATPRPVESKSPRRV